MRWREAGVLAFVGMTSVACGGWQPPAPPPNELIPPPPPLPDRSASEAASAWFDEGDHPEPEAVPPANAVEPPAPPASTEPAVRIVIEPPYKLDAPPQPKTQDEYQRAILDRRHWNDGGLGELVAELPGPVGHPDPRVVVNVDRVVGPHDKATVQRLARRNFWIEVVRCYRLGFYKDHELRGWTKARMVVAANGKVRSTKRIETELDDPQVSSCMIDKLKTLRFPAARAASRVELSLRVGPGDDPLPPPDELLVAGEGKLEPDAMHRGVESGLTDFEACYRAAFAYAPALWGRIAIRFHLTERGELDEAFQVGSRFPDERVSQCVLRAARQLRFDQPKDGDLRFVVALRLSSDRADTRGGAHPASAAP
jgi:hypothetical protein